MSSQEARHRAIDLYKSVFPARRGDTVDDVRQRFDAMLGGLDVPADTAVSKIEADGVPALQVTARGASSDRALLWFHGGGYAIGSASGYTGLASALSSAGGMSVIVPDYRLGPEHPFPAAVEDAAAALHWLVERYGDYAAVGGDSAGGALVFAALTTVRDAGAALPRRAVAVSPLVDLSARGASFDANAATDVALSRAAVANGRATYLQGHDPLDPRASPVAADLDGLPPALVLVSSSEVLLDDARLLVDRITESGGEATLVVEEEMVHVWPLFSSFLDEGARAIDQIAEFLR
jgi:epsilon-lactone hydrolase